MADVDLRPELTSLYTGHWVDGAGPMDAVLCLVGQAPGETEALRGEPFVGRAGLLLRRAAAEAGLEWSELRRTNCVRCRPPGNRPPTKDELREYWPWLERELASMPRLRVIVALGNEALWVLTGRWGVTRHRGRVYEWRGVRVVPTVHPAYVLRSPDAYPTLVADLRYAARLAAGGVERPLLRVVDRLPEGLGPVAVDVEVDAEDRITVLAAAVGREAVVLTDPRQLPAADRWVAHNALFDLRVLRAHGVDLTGRVDDTMLAAHLLDERRPAGLKELVASELTAEPYWEDVLEAVRRRQPVDPARLADYCANDAAATWLLWERFDRQLQGRLRAVYERLSLPLLHVLLRMEEHGVPIDVAYGEQLAADLARRAQELERELATTVPEAAGVNLQSSAQVAALLFERLGLTPVHTTSVQGRGSTDERSLRELAQQHPAAEILWRYRKAVKLGQMVRAWLERTGPDGRVHPRYNPVGTVTGRISGRDPNPQNLPPDARGIVAAPEGHVLVWADYASIELVLGAWIYGEPTILEAYNAGRDLHLETARRLLGRDDVDREERKRFGKTPNFGLLYGQSAAGFREYAAKGGVFLTLGEAEDLRSAWHAAYPGIQRGWARLIREAEANGYVEAPSGRRRRVVEMNEVVNFPVQCTAAELTHAAAIVADDAVRSLYGGRLILHVHDSLVFMVPEEFADRCAATLHGLMAYDAPRYLDRHLDVRLPFVPRVEVNTGRRWS